MAAVAAAQQQKLRQQEEEEMTEYSKNDLDGWEFKIVRANLKSFRNSHELNGLLQEESQAGWELVEKFDDHRLRLKRKISARKNDYNLSIDPYRTTIGPSDKNIAMLFLIAMFVFLIFIISISSL